MEDHVARRSLRKSSNMCLGFTPKDIFQNM